MGVTLGLLKASYDTGSSVIAPPKNAPSLIPSVNHYFRQPVLSISVVVGCLFCLVGHGITGFVSKMESIVRPETGENAGSRGSRWRKTTIQPFVCLRPRVGHEPAYGSQLHWTFNWNIREISPFDYTIESNYVTLPVPIDYYSEPISFLLSSFMAASFIRFYFLQQIKINYQLFCLIFEQSIVILQPSSNQVFLFIRLMD